MELNLKKYKENNPNWPVLFVLLIPLCCLGWYLSLSLGNPKYSYDPKISPSGDLIAFECIYLFSSDYSEGLKNDGVFIYPKRDICIKDLDNNKIIRVTSDQGKYSPNWSSDSSKLAWLSTNGKDELVIWNRLTDEYQKFTLPSNFWYMYPDFEYDYLEWINNDTQIVVQGMGIILHINENKFQVIHKSIDGEDVRYYLVSPNGKYIGVIWNYEDLDEKDGYGEEYRFGVFDREMTLLKDVSLQFEIPAWSNNSEYLCFLKTKSNERGVWRDTLVIAEASSGESLELDIPNVNNIYYPVWSKNDTQIVFAVFDDEIHILDLNFESDPFGVEILKHSVIDVTPEVGLNPMSISKDGSTVAYSSYAGHDLIIEYITE
jgi:hypothetical protein